VGFKDYMPQYLPPWLHGPNGLAWARAIGDVKDGMTATLKERVAARFPVRPGTSLPPIAPTGALEALGREQQMPRALGESDAEYAARLADAFDIWAYAGTAYGLLRALRAAGFGAARICISKGKRYSLDADGGLVVEAMPAGSWCTEPEPQPFWSRFVVLFDVATGLPPDWYGPEFAGIGSREELFDELGTTTSGPVLTIDDGDVVPPTSILAVRVRVPSASQADSAIYEYSLDDGVTWLAGQDSTDTAFGVGHLLTTEGNGDGDSVGLRLQFPDQDGDYSGDEVYRWPLLHTSVVSVPGEEALRIRGLRQHIAKWKASLSSCFSIVIVEAGACWDSNLGTWDDEAAEGGTWDEAVVHVYHP
jgi:hypothetical protein